MPQLLIDGGFGNATLRRILDTCDPNDRKKKLPLKIAVQAIGTAAHALTFLASHIGAVTGAPCSFGFGLRFALTPCR